MAQQPTGPGRRRPRWGRPLPPEDPATGCTPGLRPDRVRLPAASRPAPVDAVPWPVRAAVVPAECADGLERARDVLAQIPDALEALRNLDTARPQEILDRLQRLQPEVNSLATRCRERVGD